MTRWFTVAFVAAWAVTFGLAVATFDGAASGHERAAVACALAFVAVNVVGVVWLIFRAIRRDGDGTSPG